MEEGGVYDLYSSRPSLCQVVHLYRQLMVWTRAETVTFKCFVLQLHYDLKGEYNEKHNIWCSSYFSPVCPRAARSVNFESSTTETSEISDNRDAENLNAPQTTTGE